MAQLILYVVAGPNEFGTPTLTAMCNLDWVACITVSDAIVRPPSIRLHRMAPSIDRGDEPGPPVSEEHPGIVFFRRAGLQN